MLVKNGGRKSVNYSCANSISTSTFIKLIKSCKTSHSNSKICEKCYVYGYFLLNSQNLSFLKRASMGNDPPTPPLSQHVGFGEG